MCAVQLFCVVVVSPMIHNVCILLLTNLTQSSPLPLVSNTDVHLNFVLAVVSFVTILARNLSIFVFSQNMTLQTCSWYQGFAE